MIQIIANIVWIARFVLANMRVDQQLCFAAQAALN